MRYRPGNRAQFKSITADGVSQRFEQFSIEPEKVHFIDLTSTAIVQAGSSSIWEISLALEQQPA